MKTLAHLAADRAAFHDDGTLTIFRTGVTEIPVVHFPATCGLAVVTRVELEYAEANQLSQMGPGPPRRRRCHTGGCSVGCAQGSRRRPELCQSCDPTGAALGSARSASH